jgi:D-3-phosphoglycerate dehydrogenase
MQATQGALCSITVTYSGELTGLDTAPLTPTILKGALSTYLSDVNYVNATFLAKERGIRVTEQKVSDLRGFTNLITVEVVTDRRRRTVAGTLLNGLGARIVNIDGYSIDVLPRGHLLLIQHRDQPGAIGRVGTLLGEHGINIATMQVGRRDVGGQAIMMLSVDKPVPPDIRQSLARLENIETVQEIDL